MADFLGLGVMFSGIDKGMKKSIDETVMGFNKISDTMNEVEKAGAGKQKAKGGIFSNVIEGMKLVSISRIGSALQDIHTTMVGTQSLTTDFYDTLEAAGAKVRSALDPKSATEFTNAMQLGMMTPEQLEQLSSGILKFGVNSKQAAAVFPMMRDLVGKVGLDAAQVAQMFGQGLATLRATPQQITKLVKETAKLQKGFQLTDQIDNLPAFFEIATKNAARFGKVNADVTLRTVSSLSKLAMSFQKVGMSQDQAKNAAVGFADKLGNMQNELLDMQAGIEPTGDSIFRLQEALSHIPGMSANDAMNIIANNLGEPKKLFSIINTQLQDLDADTKNRVTQKLRRIFGDEITNAASAYGKDIDKAVKGADTRAETLGSADAEFKKLSDTLGGTLAKQQQVVKNAKEMFKVAEINAMRKEIQSYLNNQIKSWQTMTTEIGKADSLFGKIVKYLGMLDKMGVSGFFSKENIDLIGKVFGMEGDLSKIVAPEDLHVLGNVMGVLGALVFPLLGVIGLFKIFGGVLSVLLFPFKLLLKLFGLIGPIGTRSGGMLTKAMFLWGEAVAWVQLRMEVVGKWMKTKFMKVWSKLGDAVKWVGRGLRSFGGWLVKWGSKAGFVFRTVGIFFMESLVAPVMAGLSAVAAFFGVSVGVVVVVIAVLVAALVGLYVYWDEVVEAFDKGLAWLGKAFDDAWAFIERGIAAFQKGGFSGLIDFVFSEFTEFFEDLEKGVNNLFQWINNAIDAFKAGGISGVWDFFLDSAVTAFIAIGTKVRAIFSDIMAYAKDAFKGIDKYIPEWAGGSAAVKESNITVPKKVEKTAEEPGFFSSLLGGNSDSKQPDSPTTKVAPVASMNQQGAPSESRRPLSIKMQEKKEVDDRNFQALIDEVYDSKIVLAALLQELVKKSGSKVRITGDMQKLFRAVEEQTNDTAAASGINHAINAG